jgi:hypothetical protein
MWWNVFICGEEAIYSLAKHSAGKTEDKARPILKLSASEEMFKLLLLHQSRLTRIIWRSLIFDIRPSEYVIIEIAR